jgi:drug/metabolite transporter (DMT)-like permease
MILKGLGMSMDPIPLPQSPALAASAASAQRGALLVIGSALVWSFGGFFARMVENSDGWTVVFWRSLFACAFLLAFLFVRDGRRGFAAFLGMGLPGLVVALCFAAATICFVMALQLTNVANVVMIGAAVPLVAALISWLVFGERIAPATWAAIAAVLAGVAVMVSDSIGNIGSLKGNLLAVVITVVFSIATVVTRRYSGVRMTPAVAVATFLAGAVAFTQSADLAVTGRDMAWLFAFGALNLGLGMALFVTGARLVPAANAALLGTLETVLGPLWVWLLLGETASGMTLIGGVTVIFALLAHLFVEQRRGAG